MNDIEFDIIKDEKEKKKLFSYSGRESKYTQRLKMNFIKNEEEPSKEEIDSEYTRIDPDDEAFAFLF